MLGMLAKLLKALNSESAPWQVAAAFSLALVVGLPPLLSLHNIIVLLLAFIIRINLSAFFLGIAFYSALGFLINPLSIAFGEHLLGCENLQEFWTALYQSDFWRATKFNHTLTLGGLTLSLILFIPLFFINSFLITAYREKFMIWVEKLKVVKLLKASKFYKIYTTLAD
jgi:uncharacterized protein (TIGR03546 family)